ncbi:MAG: ATP-binding protein [Deltaproteobacteria bacterium]|nr:MAG: ATP-binding protein [Deltaproteobacteria bacterium]
MMNTEQNYPEEMKIFCDTECLEKVRDFVRSQAIAAGLPQKEIGKLVLAADEASSNIVKHAYRFQSGHNIYVSWKENNNQAVIEIRDESDQPYLPEGSDFDLDTKLKYRHVSGYGHYMLDQLVDDVHYETTPGSHNKISLIKFLNPDAAPKEKPKKKDAKKQLAFSLNGVLSLANHLAQERHPDILVKMYLYGLMGLFSSYPISILIPKGKSEPFYMAGQVGLSSKILPSEIHIPRYGWLPERLRIGKGPLLAHSLKSQGIQEEEMSVIDKIRAALVVPVFLRDHLTAIVCLGPKKNKECFSETDVNITQMITVHTLLLWERALEKQVKKNP